MSDEQKRKFNPNATIQIDLDQVQLVDPNAPKASLPPPLPIAPATPSVAPDPQAAGKTILYVAMIMTVVAIAIAGGLAVGRSVGRGNAPATPPSAASLQAAAPTIAASASARTLTLPTVEMK